MPPPTRASLPLHPPHPTLSHTYGPYVDVIVAKMSRLNVSRSETQGSAPETSAKSHQLKNTKEATHAARFWQRPAGVQATGDRRDSPSLASLHKQPRFSDFLQFTSSIVPGDTFQISASHRGCQQKGRVVSCGQDFGTKQFKHTVGDKSRSLFSTRFSKAANVLDILSFYFR